MQPSIFSTSVAVSHSMYKNDLQVLAPHATANLFGLSRLSIEPPVGSPNFRDQKGYGELTTTVHINNRTLVCPMSTKNIIEPTHDRHKPHNQAAIVHRIRCNGCCGGKESEYEDDKEIYASSSVDNGSKRLPDFPWAPYKIPSATRKIGVP